VEVAARSLRRLQACSPAQAGRIGGKKHEDGLCAAVEMRPLDFLRIGVRGDRMPARMQAKGQRKVKED